MRTKKTWAVVLALVFALVAAISIPAFADSTIDDNKIDVPSGYTQLVDWSRLAGQTRHDTMKEISQSGFESADTVIVASSVNFPDALSATALAGYYDSPILFTTADTLTDQCAAELRRLGATKAIVTGSTAVMSENTFSQIESIVGEGNATRIGGLDRYETSFEIYSEGKEDGIWNNTAIVVSGMGFADALSMSPWAYANQAPIFLANSEGKLSEEALTAIRDDGFEHVVIAGGTAVIPTSTKTQLEGIVGAEDVVRLAGENRYGTSEKVVA